MNITLMTVALTYFILILPMIPVEFNLLDMWGSHPAYYSLVIYSAYWWIYAINLIWYSFQLTLNLCIPDCKRNRVLPSLPEC